MLFFCVFWGAPPPPPPTPPPPPPPPPPRQTHTLHTPARPHAHTAHTHAPPPPYPTHTRTSARTRARACTVRRAPDVDDYTRALECHGRLGTPHRNRPQGQGRPSRRRRGRAKFRYGNAALKFPAVLSICSLTAYDFQKVYCRCKRCAVRCNAAIAVANAAPSATISATISVAFRDRVQACNAQRNSATEAAAAARPVLSCDGSTVR